MTPTQAQIEMGARAVHANECCSDWPSRFCDGPTPRDVLHAEAVLTAVLSDIEAQIATLPTHTVRLNGPWVRGVRLSDALAILRGEVAQ